MATHHLEKFLHKSRQIPFKFLQNNQNEKNEKKKFYPIAMVE
jgi:hypothetical protein